jgi:hypothetical protein
MEIKKTGSGIPAVDSSQNTGSVEQTRGQFGAKLQPPVSNETPSKMSAVVASLKSRFSRRDLDNSTKTESIVNTAVRELMLDDLPQAAQLGESDKEFLANTMAKDPVISGRVMNFLKQTLE